MTGLGALIRLILRRDRVLLPVWILISAVLPATIAASTARLYTDQAARDAFTHASMNSPAQLATRGVIYDASVGGLTAWTLGSSGALIGGLISILLVIRHTRVEEETGRRELLSSGVVGRHAPLAAALVVVLAANLLLGLLSVPGLVANGLPAGSSLLFGLSSAAAGWCLAAVAAVAAQLTAGSGTARGIAFATGGVLFAIRSAADSGGVGWLAWLSPFGWVRLTRPYAGDHWWVLAVAVVFVAVAGAAAFALSARRDLAGGLLPTRAGPAEGSLGGAFALAGRLHRGTLIGFTIGFAAVGGMIGFSARGLDTQLDTRALRQLAETIGGPGAGVADVFFTFILYVMCQLVAGAALVSALRARTEEAAGRADLLLSTPVGRLHWALGHLFYAVFGPALLLAVLGGMAGLAYDGGLLRVAGATLAYLPAVWTVVGVAVLLFGVLPRLAAAVSWSVLGLILAVDLVAEFKLAGGFVLELSPFVHVPALLLGRGAPAAALLWLTALAAALAAAGLVVLRRRDLAPSS